MPWLTYSCIKHLKHTADSTMAVFEYGSGGSTLFFANNVKSHIAVEHHQDWYGQVKRIITEKRLENVQLLFRPPRPIANPDDAQYTSSDKDYADLTFRDYCCAIDNFPDSSFDIVLIDGRSRNACIKHCIAKIKPGGSIILDNAERQEYTLGKRLLTQFEQKDYSGPGPYNRTFWTTSVFNSPKNTL